MLNLLANPIAAVATLYAFAEERLKSEKGATAVEYGLMVGLIAVVIITVVATLGEQPGALFQNVSDELPAAP